MELDGRLIIEVIIAIGGLAWLGTAVTAWVNRRKTNAEAVSVVTSTTVDFTKSVNQQYEVVEARLARAEDRAMKAEQRADRLEDEVRSGRRRIRELEDQVAELRREIAWLREQLGDPGPAELQSS